MKKQTKINSNQQKQKGESFEAQVSSADINTEENLVEKSPFLKQIEKQEERGIVKIDFEEKPIQTIKKAKKPLPTPQKRIIQEAKAVKSEEKPKIEHIAEKIRNAPISERQNDMSKKVIKKLPIKNEEIKEIKQEISRDDAEEMEIKREEKAEELERERLGNPKKMYATHTIHTIHTEEEMEIEDLEKEIKAKKKLLNLKKEEEIERIERERLRQLEAENKKLAESQIPQEMPKAKTQDVRLIYENDQLLKICPLCSGKIRKSKVNRNGFILTQSFGCKNKMCSFKKQIVVRI